MGKIIYVTGAPATGKSTLCKMLAAPDSGIYNFCYSERLRDHVGRDTGIALNETDIRQKSAQIVTAKHVDEVDDLLFEEAKRTRSAGTHLLIDSHPVTKERYGFRVTPFSYERLCALEIDTFICLYAAPEVLAKRIRNDSQGRPLPNDFDVAIHVQLQASVAAQYAVLTGRSCHLVDSNISPDELVAKINALAKFSE